MNCFSLVSLFFILLQSITSFAAANRAGEEWDRLNAEIDLLHREGKLEDAIKVAKSALDLAEEAVGTDDRDYLRSLENLGLLHQFNQEYGVAESLFNQSLVKKEALFGSDHPAVASVLNKLAQLNLQMGKHEEAGELLLRAVTIISNDSDSLSSLEIIASHFRDEDRMEALEKQYLFELELYELELGRDHPEILPTLDNLGLLYKYQGRYEEALILFHRMLAINEQTVGPFHPSLLHILDQLTKLYQATGQREEVDKLVFRADYIRMHQL